MGVIRGVAILLVFSTAAFGQSRPAPILDMHLHAFSAAHVGPPRVALCTYDSWPVVDPREQQDDYGRRFNAGEWCTTPMWSAPDDETLMKQSLAILERRNIYAVTSGPPEHVKRWQKASPARIIPSMEFGLHPGAASPDAVRAAFEKKEFLVFGEVINQYFGIAPDDARFAPYWAIAEELDIPVGIHLGPGPPGTPYLGPMFGDYKAAHHSPLLLEPVLRRHPKLRLYVMHAGWPMLDEMIAMMYVHPQLYVDVSVLDHAFPPEEFYRYLKALVTAGFGKRVLFGSDQMVWPGAIEVAIARIESAPFLTAEQKRDIFYNNAARFLRLSEEEMRRHR
jgi:uncharacterized protein